MTLWRAMVKQAARALRAAAWRPWPRRGPHERPEGGAAHLTSVRYLVAGEACAQARLALVRGDTDGAAACIERAAHVDGSHPELPELRARLALACGRVDEAHATLERSAGAGHRLRLLNQLLRMQVGQTAGAHLELSDWSRQRDCPPRARALAAALDWQSGDIDAARRRLAVALRDGADADALRLATLIDLAAAQPASAEAHAGQLRQRFGHLLRVRAFLRSIGADQPAAGQRVSLDLIDQLTVELYEHPDTIPTLAAAQRWAPQPDRIELLRRAIGRVVDDLDEPGPAFEALAELSMLADDHDAARRWARRGLEHHPMSARLALILDRIDAATEAPQPSAEIGTFAVLRRVADAHPDYADVQRALIRRYRRAGMNDLARDQARAWLERHPRDPIIAGEMAGEAAA